MFFVVAVLTIDKDLFETCLVVTVRKVNRVNNNNENV